MANFIRLTSISANTPKKQKIWINVNQIITIKYFNAGSLIETTGITQNGYTENIVVEEEPAYILDLMNNRPPKEKTW